MTKTIIEKTAINLCAQFYEDNRMMGNPCLDPKTGMPYRNQRAYVRKNFERFITMAVEASLSLLGRADTPDEVKQEIYEAILERVEYEPMINGTPVGQYLKH